VQLETRKWHCAVTAIIRSPPSGPKTTLWTIYRYRSACLAQTPFAPSLAFTRVPFFSLLTAVFLCIRLCCPPSPLWSTLRSRKLTHTSGWKQTLCSGHHGVGIWLLEGWEQAHQVRVPRLPSSATPPPPPPSFHLFPRTSPYNMTRPTIGTSDFSDVRSCIG
jgi:hypothetical protein